MAELHSNIYFKHPDFDIQKQLVNLFEPFQENDKKYIEKAILINASSGEKLTRALLDDMERKYCDTIGIESIHNDSGYAVMHMVNGGSGDYITGRIVKFLYDLCPTIHAQAWGCGDDDPWEYWFKYENGYIMRCDDEPYCESNNYILNTIYRWWKEGMPETIVEGILSEEEDEDEDEEEITDADYQEWLTELHAKYKNIDTDDNIAQGIESPLSDEDGKEILNDMKDLVGAMGDLFSMVKDSSDIEHDPQKNAFEAVEVTEELMCKAFDDHCAAFLNKDAEGILKHYSKNLSGRAVDSDKDFPNGFPVSYAIMKMGITQMVKPEMQYESVDTIDSVMVKPDGKGEFRYSSKTKIKDPETKKLTEFLYRNLDIWEVVEGKLQITYTESEELDKKIVETD